MNYHCEMTFNFMGFLLLFSLSIANAQDNGFRAIPSDFKIETKDELVVTNMASIRSQDSLGICYSFVAGTMVDTVRCKLSRVDCSKLPPEKSASVLDITRYGITSDRDVSVKNAKTYFDYRGIYQGGDPGVLLNRLLTMKNHVSEKCAPFDQIVNKSQSHIENLKLLEGSWERLRGAYSKFKEKEKSCATCAADFASTAIDDIREDFDLKASNTQVLKAFAEQSYEKFLDKLLVPEECQNPRKMLRFGSGLVAEYFPKENKSTNYGETMEVVKKVLKSDLPLGLGFCMDEPYQSMSNCKNGHGVVITGYRKFCKTPNNCREAIKVQNSWGLQWQKDNDDGWIDAKNILDRSGYNTGVISWIQSERAKN